MSEINKSIWDSAISSPFKVICKDPFVSQHCHDFHCEGANGWIGREVVLNFNIQKRSHRVNRHSEIVHDYLRNGYDF